MFVYFITRKAEAYLAFFIQEQYVKDHWFSDNLGSVQSLFIW